MFASMMMRVSTWFAAGRVKDDPRLGGIPDGRYRAEEFFEADGPGAPGTACGEIAHPAIRGAIDCQPVSDARREEEWHDAEVEAEGGKFVFLRKVLRMFGRNRENPNISRTSADLADIADERFKASETFRHLRDRGIDPGVTKVDAKAFNGDFEAACATSRAGRELLADTGAALARKLAEGGDRLAVNKVTTIGEENGEIRIRGYETVTSPNLPEAAATMVFGPDGLSRTQKERLLDMDADAPATAKPVTATFTTCAGVFPVSGDAPLHRQIVGMYRHVDSSTHELRRPYWKEEIDAYERTAGVEERERDRRMAEIGRVFFPIVEKMADDLRGTMNVPGAWSGTFRESYRSAEGSGFMDVQQASFETNLSTLVGSGGWESVGIIGKALDQHNMEALSRHDPRFSTDGETLNFMGQPLVKDDLGSYDFADEDAAFAAIGVENALGARISMMRCPDFIRDLSAKVTVNACYNGDFSADRQFGVGLEVSISVPDAVKAMPAFAQIENAMPGFPDGGPHFGSTDGLVHFGSVRTSSSLPNAESFHEGFSAHMEEIFRHSAYAEKLAVREERRQMEFEARNMAEAFGMSM